MLFGYFIRRFLLFIPTLLVISWLTFGLQQCSPVDPVLKQLQSDGQLLNDAHIDQATADKRYRDMAQRLGMDLPLFYFSLRPKSYPDSIYQITPRVRRRATTKLARQTGDWPVIHQFWASTRTLQQELNQLPDSLHTAQHQKNQRELTRLLETGDKARLQHRMDVLAKSLPASTAWQDLQTAHTALQSTNRWQGRLIPKFRWHGTANQYHRWISRWMKGDWGTSYRDGRPVRTLIWAALRWTLLLNGIAALLAYGLSIPLGLQAGFKRHTSFDRRTTILLLLLYSLPIFWIGTLLLTFLTNSQYGMDWFPALWVGTLPEGTSIWTAITTYAWHLSLPVFCLTYGALAFIYRQMRSATVDVLDQPFVRTAVAKGLSPKRIRWRHVFPNALFPLITLLANLFPFLLGGAFVVEELFDIPGMGRLTISAIRQDDFPIVYSVVMLSAVLTMLGMLIADVLYVWADPRLRFKKK